MKRLTAFVIFIPLFLSSAFTQPRSATEILNEANSRAAKENKNVFVIFHASWCGWYQKMDSAMNDPACLTPVSPALYKSGSDKMDQSNYGLIPDR